MGGFLEGFVGGFAETGAEILKKRKEGEDKFKQEADLLRMKTLEETKAYKERESYKHVLDKEMLGIKTQQENAPKVKQAAILKKLDAGELTEAEATAEWAASGGDIRAISTWSEIKEASDPAFAAKKAQQRKYQFLQAGFNEQQAQKAALGSSSGKGGTNIDINMPSQTSVNAIQERLMLSEKTYDTLANDIEFLDANPQVVGVIAKGKDIIADFSTQTKVTDKMAKSLGIYTEEDRQKFQRFQTSSQFMVGTLLPTILNETRATDPERAKVEEALQALKTFTDPTAVMAAYTYALNRVYRDIGRDVKIAESGDVAAGLKEKFPELYGQNKEEPTPEEPLDITPVKETPSIPQITSAAERDALPDGASYIYNGKTYKKKAK
jgi:hypothetical protein